MSYTQSGGAARKTGGLIIAAQSTENEEMLLDALLAVAIAKPKTRKYASTRFIYFKYSCTHCLIHKVCWNILKW